MLLKGGNIHLEGGRVLKDHSILIEGSKIGEIGRNLDEKGRKVIDLRGMEVYPGFIDPVSSYGCMDLNFRVKDHNELEGPFMPDLEIKYSFNPHEIVMEELYKVGITTIGAAPGNLNVIGGNISAYNTYGLSLQDYLVRENLALKGSVTDVVKAYFKEQNKFPMTKMGIFKGLMDWLEDNRGEDNISGQVIRGEKPFFVRANTAMEIRSLLNLFKDTDIRLVLVGAYEFDRCIDEILDYGKISLVMGEQNNLTIKKYYNTDLESLNLLLDKGILVSYTLSGEYSPEGSVKYLWNGIDIYRSGVDSARLMDMMTVYPARILGLDDLIGSIEQGKFADLAIYDKNPIESYDSRLIYSVIKGKLIYKGEK